MLINHKKEWSIASAVPVPHMNRICKLMDGEKPDPQVTHCPLPSTWHAHSRQTTENGFQR